MRQDPKLKLATEETVRMEDQHQRVQDHIETLPEDTKKSIKAIQKLVDHEIAQNNALFFNDGMFAVDAFLKRNQLPGSCKDDLIVAIQRATVGNLFMFREKPFIKSHDGLVHAAQDYIRSLELTVVEQVEFKEVKYVSYNLGLDKLSPTILIKQAIKNLFKRNKNG